MMKLRRYEVWSVPKGEPLYAVRPLREARCFTRKGAWRIYLRVTVAVETLDFYVVQV